MEKKLYRSRANKVIAGVCGGMGEYFSIDPIIIRIAWVIISLAMAGTGIIIYIAAAIIMPERQGGFNPDFKQDFKQDREDNPEDDFGSVVNDFKEPAAGIDPEKSKVVIGVALIIFGVMFFAKQFFHWIDMKYFLPVVLIAIGLVIIFKGGRNRI
ncbi:MAG: PspC domain-containing protein [Clostridiales bacterium]|jgi:phage shock protein C|nr:PspC domain-containing protein [Eubacteriales bacterium]MDH7566763.1 PspC domain-containing protein [Clostridiales bacterium]